jgi:hypothetical protein
MTRSSAPAVVLLVAIVVATSVRAQTPAAPDYQALGSALRVRLLPDKSTLMAGESVSVSLEVTNVGSQAFQLLDSRLEEDGCFTDVPANVVRAVRADGFQAPLAPDRRSKYMVCNGRTKPPPMLAPGGAYRFSLFLPEWVRLSTPGAYTLIERRRLLLARAGDDRQSKDWCRVEVEARASLDVVPHERDGFGTMIATLGSRALGANEDAADSAMTALAAIDDEAVVDMLARAAVSRYYSVKFIALDALGRFATDQAFAALQQAVAKEEPALRHLAAIAIARSPHPRATQALFALADSPDVPIRNTVVQMLSHMDSTESLALLRQLATDPDPTVAREAQRYVGLRQVAGGKGVPESSQVLPPFGEPMPKAICPAN